MNMDEGSIQYALLPIAADHPVFAGHFPGMPIVPGVVLLDEVLHAIGQRIGADLAACQISALKFLSPVAPGEPVTVQFTVAASANGSGVRFDIISGERKVATGSIRTAQRG